MTYALFAALAAALAIGAASTAVPRPLTPDDFYRIQVLSDPQVAPDGAWVAYVVTTNDRDADEPRSAIWMVSWDGTEHVPLTNPSNGLRAPRWSPDSRRLTFIGTPPGADHEQILVLDRRGGEASTLTSLTDQIADYAWSPDGKRLVLVLQPPGDDDTATGKSLSAPKAPKPLVIDDLHFKQDVDGYLTVGDMRHLALFTLDGARLEPLTADAGFNDSQPVWSPDGSRIAFVRTHQRGPDDDARADIAVVAAQPGATPTTLVRPFAPNDGLDTLAWSPDGQMIAYLEGREARFNAYIQDRLRVVPATGGPPRRLTDTLDRAVKAFAFAPDSASLTITVEDDGTLYPARIDLAGGRITRLVASPLTVAALSTVHGHTALLSSDDRTPLEINTLEDGRLRRLTAQNAAFLADLQLGAVDDLKFKSRDGTEVHAMVVTPPGYVAGRRYPTILWIHGGPNGQDEHSLDFDGYQFKRQLLAAGGYVVLGVNYRGSSGRGSAYATAIFADWGHKEVEDLLAGIDTLVARGIADPAMLAIGGWSYGGILTDYSIASDHRFKAAVSGAGSANQISMYGSDQYILQYNAELGPPWHSQALWIKLSYPFFHADRIRTPTLFLSGEKDFNVPVAGGEQMYQALRVLGVPAELVIYPGQYHEFTRPSFLVDRATRIAAWYAKHLTPAH
jgi:dipeptidyl aminopeptidase/acylaminoacyl peptidase